MSRFTEASFEKKLKDLNATQQSIQTLSLWVLHHKKHCKLVVEIWHREIYEANIKKKVILLYLANDIIQNGRKKASEYVKEFKLILPVAMTAIIKDLDDEGLKKVKRVIQVWMDRGIYDADFLVQLQNICENDSKEAQAKKVKFSVSPTFISSDKNVTPYDAEDDLEIIIKELEGGENVTHDVEIPPTEEFISMLTKLENTASGDAIIREKISKLPSAISDTTLLDKIENKEDLLKLESEVTDALTILGVYNDRLSTELEDRKRASLILAAFLQHQTKLINQTDEKIKEYRETLKKVNRTRLELQLHMDKLPDPQLVPPVFESFSNEDIFASIVNSSDLKTAETTSSSPYTPTNLSLEKSVDGQDKNKKITPSPDQDAITSTVSTPTNIEFPLTKYFLSPTLSSEESEPASLTPTPVLPMNNQNFSPNTKASTVVPTPATIATINRYNYKSSPISARKPST